MQPKKSDLVRKFITENPKFKSKKAIAQALLDKYPETFNDLESVRTIVRYVTGANGDKNREGIADPQKNKFFYNGLDKWAAENLNTENAPWDDPFIIPTSIKELNIIADIHSTHLDHKVLQKFLKATTNKEALLINGDLLDSESLSRHLKNGNVIDYGAELELGHTLLKELKAEFNHVYFKHGNHDFWLERFLLTNAREIFKVLGLDLDSLLRVGELGIDTIHNLRYISYGDLDIVHVHEFPGFGNGKFPSVGLLDKWQSFKHSYNVKVLCSHSHKNDMTIGKKSKTGEFGQAWVTPAMCRKGAQYAPYAPWDNGWCVARQTDKGTEVETIVI